jgi:uncharacterized membrane protein
MRNARSLALALRNARALTLAMRNARALTLAMALSLWPACASDEQPGEDPGAQCQPELSYESDVAPILARHCASCHSAEVPLAKRHGAPGGDDFDGEADVLARAERITRRAGIGPEAENRSMPPRGFRAPSDEERATLASFLACHLERSAAPHHQH